MIEVADARERIVNDAIQGHTRAPIDAHCKECRWCKSSSMTAHLRPQFDEFDVAHLSEHVSTSLIHREE